MKNKLASRDICLLEKQAAFTAIYKNMSVGRSDCCRFIAACGSEQEITMRVKMIVAYDGTNYKGWQVQPNGITIEEVLNKNLSNLLGEQIVVSGASPDWIRVYIPLEILQYLIRTRGCRQIKLHLHSIRDCRKILWCRDPVRWRMAGIRAIRTAEKLMNTVF